MYRHSNIELLKIMLFLMVITIHVSGHYLTHSTVTGTLNWQISHFIDAISRPAVNCFVLITGYFLSTKENTRPVKSIMKIVLLVAVNLVLYLYLYLGEQPNVPAALLAMFTDLLKNGGHFYHLWYLQVIVFIYAISNYLNMIIGAADKKKLKLFIIILGTPVIIIPTICHIIGINIFDIGLFHSWFMQFLLLYFIGAYIRRHVEIDKVKHIVLKAILCELLIVVLSFLYNYRTSPYILVHRLQGLDSSYPLTGFIGAFFDYSNILVVITSACLLLAFLKLKINNPRAGKAINYIAKLTQSGYIIHAFWIAVLAGYESLTPFNKFDLDIYPAYLIGFICLVFLCSLASSCVLERAVYFVKLFIGKIKAKDKVPAYK